MTYSASIHFGGRSTGYTNGQFVLSDSVYEVVTSSNRMNAFGLNLELGVLGSIEFNNNDQIRFFEMPLYLSGGLRYRFGKLKLE